MGVKMHKWGMMMWLKGENCVKQLRELYIYIGLRPTRETIIRSDNDVIKWKHLPRYWPSVRGIHQSPANSPHKGQWLGTATRTNHHVDPAGTPLNNFIITSKRLRDVIWRNNYAIRSKVNLVHSTSFEWRTHFVLSTQNEHYGIWCWILLALGWTPIFTS